MAKWIKWTDKQKKMWADWIASRPQVIQDMAREHNLIGDELYQLKTTSQRVTIYSLSEDGTVTVNVLAEFNQHLFGFQILGEMDNRRVFGIKPSDLKPCGWDGEVEDGAKYENLSDDEEQG